MEINPYCSCRYSDSAGNLVHHVDCYFYNNKDDFWDAITPESTLDLSIKDKCSKCHREAKFSSPKNFCEIHYSLWWSSAGETDKEKAVLFYESMMEFLKSEGGDKNVK